MYIMLSMQYSHLHVISTSIHSFQSRKFKTKISFIFFLFSEKNAQSSYFETVYDLIRLYFEPDKCRKLMRERYTTIKMSFFFFENNSMS